MKTGSPVLGGEQLIDIELDRKTELLPIRTNLIQWRDLPSFPTVEDPDPTSNSGASPEVPGVLILPSVSSSVIRYVIQLMLWCYHHCYLVFP